MSLIEIENIGMNYHSLKGTTESLKDINISINKGEFVSIIGPSGCGKSTLLNIISGLLTPSNGSITYDENTTDDSLEKMGYMFQKDYLFPWLTVWDNILLGLKIKKKVTSDNISRIEVLLKKYGLDKFKSHKPSELSGGMRQRVALIRTLALNPEVLLLDEPFSALDYQTRLNVCDDVSEIIKQEGKTAIMVTHDLGEAISISTRVIVLSSRPATVKKDVNIYFENSYATPFQRRKEPEYNKYFNILWKEIENHE